MAKKKELDRAAEMERLNNYLGASEMDHGEDRVQKVKQALAEYQAKDPSELTDKDFASFINGLRIPAEEDEKKVDTM
jgi:hypothetical protein